MRTLNNEEVGEVEGILRHRHPLYYKGITLSDIFPTLKWVPWFSKGENQKKTDQEKILSKDIERSDAPNGSIVEKEEKDPSRSFHILGFGTVAYFDFHRYLMILYGAIVALLLPSLIIFVFYGDGRRVGGSFFTQFTLANIGFTSSLCKDVTLAVGNLTLTCPTGDIGEIASFGIIPSEGIINDACLPNDETMRCNSTIDFDTVQKNIEERCLGKPYCTIDVLKQIGQKGPAECTNPYAQFYTQVFWKLPKDEVGDRDFLSIWFCVQILLTTLAYIGFLFFLRKRTSQEYTEWDTQTTTISDYTMQYEIPETVFNEYKDKIHGEEKLNPEVLGESNSHRNSHTKTQDFQEENLLFGFKIFLKKEFERILRSQQPVKQSGDDLVTISHIHLGFDHNHLHYLLLERGSAIKSGKVEKKEEIEKQIVDYVIANKEYISTPKDAYIIFETEEAYHRAMKFNLVKKWGSEMPTTQWRGTNLIFKIAKEPSNISFESKYKNKTTFIAKVILVAFILLIALLTTCYLIFFFQDRVNRLNRQYPSVNWEAVVADSTPEMLNNYAMLEYFHYETSDKSDKTILMLNTDNMQCYCDNLRDEIGYLDAFNKEFNVQVLGHDINGKVCNDYLQSSIFIKATAVVLPVMIIIFNYILKILAVSLVEWLYIENRTVNIAIMQSVVFVLMFFNSALSILLINTNVENFNDNGVFFNGLYSDFSDEWFDKISMFFISPMFAQLIFPINAFLPGYLLQKGFAMLDRSFTDPKLYKTKWNLAYDYADLNSGTEHLLFQKYPRLLNIIFVSSFYGFGLPLLPILIFVWLIISYFVDSLVVAFYHRKPPLYDDTLNVVSIHLLKWAAFFYIAIAYWMLTNKQIFGNDLKPIAYQAQIEYYDHHIFEIPDTYQECVVLAVALLILAFLIIDLAYRLLYPLYETTRQEELEEFEDLPPFYKVLDEKSLDFWVNEERQIRGKYKYKYLFDDFYQKIRDRHNSWSERKSFRSQMNHKDYILDATNYDLLYLDQYSNKYAYIPTSKRQGKTIDNDSNFTRRVLDFPYHQDTQISFHDHGRLSPGSSFREEESKKPDDKYLITSVVV